ncbi:hypothetical protein G3573_10930, partial [Caulobacter sp. 17J65-9]|nr:hypothetical protein [Caulobacter sp. 17J65-9]
ASGDVVLRRLIAAATGEGRSDAGRSGGLAVLGADPRTGVSVAAVPLPERRRPFDMGHGPLAVLTFHRRGAPSAPPAETLRRRYALTPSEARLAVALCGGASVAGYAGDNGVSNTTVKTHLRQLFAKVGEHRQVDLVRRLLSEAVAEAA